MAHAIQNETGGYTDADFWTKMASVNPRMCVCIYVEPSSFWGGSSNAIGFTSNTRNMTLPGYSITFKATPSIQPTSIESALNEPTSVEMTGIFSADTFDEDEVLNGKWDGAKVQILVTPWDDTDYGQWVVHEGDLSEFESFNHFFRAEIRGYLARLNNEVAPVTSRLCRVAEFRDATCAHAASTVDIGGTSYNIEQTLTVNSVTDEYNIVFAKLGGGANDVPDDFFAYGTLVANTTAIELGSIKRPIKSSTTTATEIEVELRVKFPFTVTVADTFDLVAGCDRTLSDCIQYSNVANFRGEPYIPGIEAANRVPPAS